MRTAICDMLGIDIPLLAFSHCRDVVAAVTNAGGFGVLGAVTLTPEQLEQELNWIEAEVRGKPYGVDLIVPETSVGKGQRLTSEQFAEMIPAEYRQYVDGLLVDHGIEPLTLTRPPRVATTDDAGESLMEVAFKHPIKLIANALGRPPQYDAGRRQVARCPGGRAGRCPGACDQARQRRRRHHRRGRDGGRRALRRGDDDGAGAGSHRRDRSHPAGPGARRGRDRHRPADGRRRGDGRRRSMDRLGVARPPRRPRPRRTPSSGC